MRHLSQASLPGSGYIYDVMGDLALVVERKRAAAKILIEL
jgi:hypothetical protein